MKKKPTDVDALAFSMMQEATGEPTEPAKGKNPAAIALGRLGGLKGGTGKMGEEIEWRYLGDFSKYILR